MKTAAIIAEFNPFHNGHKYLIEQAKKLTGADAVLVLMSGDFVQRGEPAVFDKFMRARTALLGGADLIIEIPVSVATASAELYALGCICLLNQLDCIDYLVFGSESGKLEDLKNISALLNDEPDEFKSALKEELKKGVSFPKARQSALRSLCPDLELDSLLALPNNILGIEYLKALSVTESKIIPVTVKRIGADYHDNKLNGHISSATAIRKSLHGSASFGSLPIPDNSLDILLDSWHTSGPLFADDFSLLLKFCLLKKTKTSLISIMDINDELANRILNQRNNFIGFSQFCSLISTKNVTESHVRRALLHILLDIKNFSKEDMVTIVCNARILGFRDEKKEVLSHLKKHSLIPLVTKIDEQNFSEMVFASNLYHSVLSDKYQVPFIHEKSQKIVRI